MVLICFNNEQRDNSEEGFEHESKMKIPKMETEVKMKQHSRKAVAQREGGPQEEIDEEFWAVANAPFQLPD